MICVSISRLCLGRVFYVDIGNRQTRGARVSVSLGHGDTYRSITVLEDRFEAERPGRPLRPGVVTQQFEVAS